jgi:hypothetical protein
MPSNGLDSENTTATSNISNLSSRFFRLNNGIYYPIDNDNIATRGFLTANGSLHATYQPFANNLLKAMEHANDDPSIPNKDIPVGMFGDDSERFFEGFLQKYCPQCSRRALENSDVFRRLLKNLP